MTKEVFKSFKCGLVATEGTVCLKARQSSLGPVSALILHPEHEEVGVALLLVTFVAGAFQ